MNRKIVIVNVYRPPQGDTEVFGRILKVGVTEVKVKDNSEVYVMGHMNINAGDKNSATAKNLDTILKSCGLRHLLKTCTRFSATSRATIDLIYTNSEYVSESGCIDINISDHLATYVTRKIVNPPTTKIQFEGSSY